MSRPRGQRNTLEQRANISAGMRRSWESGTCDWCGARMPNRLIENSHRRRCPMAHIRLFFELSARHPEHLKGEDT
jgi:hypothetical protein